MDCEKFESAMMDELYGELDELTSAAAKRHIASCARCATRMGGLRATRRVAALPLVEAPVGLEDRILASARDAQRILPLRRRVAQAVSLAGNWAMRPQTAMAAVFLVMVGTSVLMLRVKALGPTTASVTVTEHGTPTPFVAPPVQGPAPSLQPVAAAPPPAPRSEPARAEAKPSAPSPFAAADLTADESRGTSAARKASSRSRDDSEFAVPPPAPPTMAKAANGTT